MQLRSFKSSLSRICSFFCIGLILLCLSCSEKPKFKKKHYTTKRVARNYKASNSITSTADTKDIIIKKELVSESKPQVKEPTKEIPIIKEKTESHSNDINIIRKRQNKYYIIAASYSLETKARELALEYMKLGFPVEIISANAKFRVTLNSDNSRQKAIRLRDSLRLKLKRNDIWLLRY